MMRRKRAAGLCVAAAVATCAFAAGNASAIEFHNLPHYGKCTAKVGGKYRSAGCTKLATKPENEKYEWEPLTEAVQFKGHKESMSGEAVLEAASGVTVSSTGEMATGEYGPGDETKNVVLEFLGSKCCGVPCQSEGEAEGNIRTKKLHGEPGMVTREPKEEKNIDGTDLVGQESEFVAAFNCATASFLVKGGIVVAAQADRGTTETSGETTNKMLSKTEVEFAVEKSGKQVPEKWTPNFGGISHTGERKEVTEHLESSDNGGASYEASNELLTTIQETVPSTTKLELRQCETTISCPN